MALDALTQMSKILTLIIQAGFVCENTHFDYMRLFQHVFEMLKYFSFKQVRALIKKMGDKLILICN